MNKAKAILRGGFFVFFVSVHWTKSLLILFLLLMLGLNVQRFLSYSAKHNEPLDFRQLYAGAQLLDSGFNPYSDSLLKKQWKSNFEPKQLEKLPLPGGPENYLVYPPPFVVSMVPVSRLAWFDARIVTWSVCAGLVLLIGLLASGSLQGHTIFPVFLGLLAFKGTYIALILGQPLWLSLLFLLLHFHMERKNRPLLSGLFLALAFLKPSLALPIVFFLISGRKFKSLLYSLGFSLLILGIMVLQFGPTSLAEQFSGWFHNMNAQMAVAYSPEHDFLRNNLTSLSSWLYSLTGYDLSHADTLLLLLSSLLTVYLRLKKRIQPLTTLTLLITVSFLFSYHLYYDLLLFICLFYYVDLSRLPTTFFLPFLALYLPFGYLFPSVNFHPPLLFALFFLVIYRLTLKHESA
ncbi:MAG: glycosyltransferase family 87 protein [Bacteroidia bacterium]